MYEETKSIDWKGIFLKVIIAFLIILIAIKGYTLLKGKKEEKKESTEIKEVISNTPTKVFVENLGKLEKAGKEYFEKNKSDMPTTNNKVKTITLETLIEKELIETLKLEDGTVCDTTNSTVTATLENERVQIKSNLICESYEDYRLAYIENGKNEVKEETTSSNTIASNTSTEKQETNKVVVNNKTEETTKKVTSEVIEIKKPVVPTTTKPIKYYTVKFDKNGGSKNYSIQQIKEFDKVTYPGINQKNDCKFNGWFYNGKLYDFGTPVTNDMVLVANYTCQKEQKLVTKTYSKYIYSLGWASKDITSFNVNHTLKLPDVLKDNNITEVKLKSLVAVGSINTNELITTYKNNHNAFIYVSNGWEADIKNKSSLSTINPNSVSFEFDNSYNTVLNSMSNGFDVKWKTNNIESKCSEPFSVKTATNLCGYGIYYRATWEYKIYE